MREGMGMMIFGYPGCRWRRAILDESKGPIISNRELAAYRVGDTAFPLLPILVPITPLASFLPIPTVTNGCDLEKVGDVDRDGGVGPAAVTSRGVNSCLSR